MNNIFRFLFFLFVCLVSSQCIAESLILPKIEQLPSHQASIQPIKLNRIEFHGNAVISDIELTKVTQGFIGQTVDELQLLQIKDVISQYYLSNAFINSGVKSVHWQNKSQGILQVDLIEGRLSKIKLHGLKDIKSDFILNRAQIDQSRVLNLIELRQSLKLLEQEALIDSVDAQLQPDEFLGGAVLDIKLKQQRAYQLSLVADNYRSPAVGSAQASLIFQHQNLWGSGEAIFLKYGLWDNQHDQQVRFQLPFAWRQSVALQWDKTDASAVQEPFNLLGFNSYSERLTLNWNKYWQYQLDQQWQTQLQLSSISNNSYLLGELFAFPPNMAKVKAYELGLSLDWLRRSNVRVIQSNIRLAWGMPLAGASTSGTNADARYAKIHAQLNWLQSWLDEKRRPIADWLFKGQVQLANDNLLSIAQLAMGGHQTVRGYRENAIVRDNALLLSLEAQIPITRFIPEATAKVKIMPFIDYAYGWNVHQRYFASAQLLSVGVALNWQINKHINFDVIWGIPLKKAPIEYNNDLQDNGIHCQLRIDAF